MGQSTLSDLGEGAREILALVRLEPQPISDSIRSIVEGPRLDLVATINERVPRCTLPVAVDGIHRRALAAIEAVIQRGNGDLLVRRVRRREEFCSDLCCSRIPLADRGLIEQGVFAACFEPSRVGRREERANRLGKPPVDCREVVLVGNIGLVVGDFCSNDELWIRTTDQRGHDPLTFYLGGCGLVDGHLSGVRVNAHPILNAVACRLRDEAVRLVTAK